MESIKVPYTAESSLREGSLYTRAAHRRIFPRIHYSICVVEFQPHLKPKLRPPHDASNSWFGRVILLNRASSNPRSQSSRKSGGVRITKWQAVPFHRDNRLGNLQADHIQLCFEAHPKTLLVLSIVPQYYCRQHGCKGLIISCRLD